MKQDLPRKVLRAPGCTQFGSRICSGYVVCNRNNRSYTRLATCSENLCGNESATQCALQLGFGSKNPEDGDQSFSDAPKSKSVGVQK